MRRNRILHRFFSSLTALLMVFSILLPGSVFAENRQPETEKAAENGEKTLLTGITIIGLEAPEIGKPLPEHADVESAEGVRWEIPVFWMDEDGNELNGTAETEDCFPVLAFFLPPEYTMAEDAVIAISDEVLALFRGKTFHVVYDKETGIIYILASLTRPGLLVMDLGQGEPQEMIPLPENTLIPEDDEEPALEEKKSFIKRNKVVSMPQQSVRMVISQPTTFEQSEEICGFLKEKKSVIVNLEYVNKDVARRIVDFISGGVYCLDAHIQKVSNSIFLIAPMNYEITNEMAREEIKNKLSVSWLNKNSID